MIATKTNLEITAYREKFFLGLSLRQLACFAAAAVLAITTCFVCLHWLRMDMQVVSYIWYAIDASTGQLIWRGNANTDESLFVCGDVRPVIANGKLWCIDAQNTRPAYLSLDTGELAWTSTLEKVSSRGMTTNGSTVFYSSNSGRQITAFDAETNQVVWQKDLRYDNKDRDLQEMQIDSALVYNGTSLIHVAERGRITALNPDNGEILCCIDAAGYPERVFWSTPEATDGLVIATGIDGKVYAVEYTH